jgi:pimeloyl-ACP methyl ester carboxylesterase
MKLYSRILGEGKPLIIMHGVFGMGDNWQTLGRQWAKEYQVHLLDMRNHGRTEHKDEFSYELMSDDLLEYMEAHQIEKALILGHSMGGKVGMLFSVLNPERVEKLIVADIAPKEYEPHHQKILEALHALDLEVIRSRGEAESQFSAYIKDEGTKQFLLKSLFWKEKGKLAWRFNLNAISREINQVGDALPNTAIFFGKTMFVRGGNSWYIKDEDEDLILDHFPDASLETVAGAGHWLHAEKPKEFFITVDAFLKD